MSRPLLRAAVLMVAFVVSLWAVPRSGVAEQPAVVREYKKAAGPFEVVDVTDEWRDEKRSRDVPVRLYYPKTERGPFPVLIFSHGMGGARDGYRYLGQHWASHGYVSVHLQHKGSDASVFKGDGKPIEAMREALKDPKLALDRPLDVRFAMDRIERLNKEEGSLKGRLDLERIGMAGHSFGAYTTMAVVDQTFVLPQGKEVSFGDPRIKAAIPMSAPVTRDRGGYDKMYGSVKTPCLHMTGTLDDSPVGDTKAAERRIPFDHTTGADQYLVIFKDGDHMIFSGRFRKQAGGERDALFQELIRMASTAFWDAYLKGDAQAAQWLVGGGFEAALDGNGTFEKKLKTAKEAGKN